MIILDLNQVMIANIMSLYGKHIGKTPIELDLFRSIVLNTIRSLNKKFKVDYGQLVIASDGKHSWRKDIFPHSEILLDSYAKNYRMTKVVKLIKFLN